VEAHWKHEDDDGRLVHAEVLWGSDRISITAGEPRRCSLGLEVEDEVTVERLFERAVSASAHIEMGLTHSKVAYSFTSQDSDGNPYGIHAETGYLDQLRREQAA
ncbi:MAG: VOC family protein, partial [Pseudomonadales bacterium]